MKRIEYDYGRFVSSIETPVKICGTKACKIVNACWDTGATYTIITNALALELGLASGEEVQGFVVGRSMNYRSYQAFLDLGNEIRMNGTILGADSISQKHNISMLIGMDVISMGNFKLENLKGQTRFSFEVER